MRAKGNVEKNKVFIKFEPYEIVQAKRELLETREILVRMMIIMDAFKHECSEESKKIGFWKRNASETIKKFNSLVECLPKEEEQEKHVRLIGKRKLREMPLTKSEILEQELLNIKKRLESLG